MALVTEVGLSPGDFVLDGDPAPSQKGGRAPSTIFRPFLLWPKGWMHQDATWYGGKPQRRGLCVYLDGDRAPLPKRGQSPHFSAYVYCGQTAVWIKMPLGTEVGLGPDDIVLDGDPAIPRKRAHPPPPNFWPMSIVAKWLDG